MFPFFPLFIFFISFSAYLFSALPSIYWRDASEFQAIGFLLDIAHPAGSPFYAIVVKLFTFIPFGSIAFKTTLVSCVFGAGISVLVYWIVRTLLRYLAGKNGISSISIQWIGFFSVLVLSFSSSLWQNANLPEVYTLQNFFTALFLLIFLKISQSNLQHASQRKNLQLFFMLSFLFGLSLGAHAVLILYLPFFFLLVYFIWLRTTSFNRLNIYLLFSFFFLLGFSIYLYLPIRSAQNPYYDWGNTETFLNLIRHASDRKDASFLLSISTNVLPRQLSLYSGFFLDDFSFLGIILGLIGLIYIIVKREKVVLSLFVVIFSPPFLFFIRYWGEPSAFLPNFLVFTVFIAVGIWCISTLVNERLKDNPHKQKYLIPMWFLFGVQFLILIIGHSVQNSQRSDYWNMRTIMKDSFNDLPPQAIAFTNNTWFGLNYLQQVEGYRPDLSILHLSSILAPQWFTKMNASNFQNIFVPDLPPEELGKAPLLGSALLTENIATHPIYWEPTGKWNYLVERYLIPGKYFFKITPDFSKPNNAHIPSVTFSLSEKINLVENIKAEPERGFYSELFSAKGAFFLDKGLYEDALPHLKLAVSFLPEAEHLNLLAVGYAYLNEYQIAEELFLKSIEKDPHKSEPSLNLARMYAANNNLQKAEFYFNKVLNQLPSHIDSLFMLGKIKVAEGKKKEALNYFNRVLEVDSNHSDASREIDQLRKKLS